jgi:hypothetical protein
VALDRTLAAAFIDNDVRHTILGRHLRPFSLWHRLLLQAVHSPFLCGDQLRFFDMREAVGVCQLSYPHSRVKRPWIVPFGCYLWYGFPRKRWTKFLKQTRDRLLEYFGDYISQPEYSIKTPEAPPGPPLGEIPEGFVIVCDVISFLNCSEDHAWDIPVGRAYWYQMGYRNKTQIIDFLTEEERKFQAEMKEGMKKEEAA